MDSEALGRQSVAVLGFLHQRADLSQEAVQEPGQHGRTADYHHVLRQNLASVDGTLVRNKHTMSKDGKTEDYRCNSIIVTVISHGSQNGLIHKINKQLFFCINTKTITYQ